MPSSGTACRGGRSNRKAAHCHRWAAHHACLLGPTLPLNAPVCPPDEKEESILGSIPLLSFRVAAVQPSDNISRKHTFKVSVGPCGAWGRGGADAGGIPAVPSSRFLGGGAWSRAQLWRGELLESPGMCWGN